MLLVQFYAPGTSVITVLHCYHIVLNFCQMNSIFGGYFFRVLLFGKYFLGVLSVAKHFFSVVQKYPTPLISVCMFIKSTPWVDIMDTYFEFRLYLLVLTIYLADPLT